ADGKKVDTRAVIDQLRVPLAAVPKLSFQLADSATGGDLILGGKDIVIEVEATKGSYDELGEAALALSEQLATIPGVTDIDVSYQTGTPEMQIKLDRARAADLGLSTAQVGSTLRTLVNGEIAGVFRGEGPEANIRVQLSEQDRAGIENILNLGILAPSGQIIPLRAIADAEIAAGPNEIISVDRSPVISIGANASGRDLPDVTEDVTALLESVSLPEGMTARLGGDAQAQAESF